MCFFSFFLRNQNIQVFASNTNRGGSLLSEETISDYSLLEIGTNALSSNIEENAESYRLLVENANDAIFITVEGFIVFHNRKTELLTGFSPLEIQKIPFSSLILHQDRGRIHSDIDSNTQSFRILNKAGDELWCQSSYVSIKWAGKSGILWFLRDLTLQKKLEDQLHQSQKIDALGTMVAGVAHEINNPINLIMYNMPIIKNVWSDVLPLVNRDAMANPARKYGGLKWDFLEENFDQLLSDIDMAANRVAKIVSDLKNFSKQSDVADKRPLHINPAVNNALRIAQSTLKKSNIQLDLTLTDNLPQIYGNLHSIEQIILNILINAAQSIVHGQGKISIKTGYQVNTGQVYVSISDNGRGINPSISDKIFDPFVTDKQNTGGTGLGLSVSYNLVKAHEGEILFKNREKGGAVFTVFLPVRPKGKARKILIVDDDEMVREILVEVLTKNENYRVEEALNGIEACIKLGTYQPDLLVLDILMPEMDGLEVCRTIIRNDDFSDLKVMITTGYPDHPKVNEVKQLGFTNIHGKPFNIKDFLSNVDKILTP
jgi:PAS domain S-box-containing protein